MKPSQLASQLRRIASAIDSSRNPDRRLVARDLKKVLASVSMAAGMNGIRAIIGRVTQFLWHKDKDDSANDGNEGVIGIEVDFKGKKYLCNEPCDDEGEDTSLENASSFRLIERICKGQPDKPYKIKEVEKLEKIKEVKYVLELGTHPLAKSTNFEDDDGDYIYHIWMVWFSLSDVDNIDEVNALMVHTS